MQKNYYSMVVLFFFCCTQLWAQEEKELAPVTRTYALTNARIIQAPGRKIEKGTVVIKDGLIHSVGASVVIPSDAVIIKADSMFVYAGFIDGFSRAGVTKPKEEQRERPKDPGKPTNERAGITPQNDVRNFLNPSDKAIEDLRNIGFTTAQVVPHGNLLPGQAAIISLSGRTADAMVLANNSAMYSELSGAEGVYPATIIGVMAKWRDLYRQAQAAKANQSLYASNRVGLERPASDRVLESFYPVIDQRMPMLFKSEKLLETQRVLMLRNDLKFPLIVGDVKEGWPIAGKLKSAGAKVFLSLDLPEEVKKDDKKADAKDGAKKEEPKKEDKPKSAAELEKAALEKRKTDAIANFTGQAASFNKAGIPFGFSTMSAKPKDIPANLRRMIAAGLPEDAALASLTTTPAQLLGLSDRLGTVDNGKMANLIVTDKPYFNEKAKVRYVFVEGSLYKMEVKETKKVDPNAKVEIQGSWSTTTDSPQGKSTNKVTFKKDGTSYSGTISGGRLQNEIALKSVTLEGNALNYSYTLSFGGRSIDVEVSATVEGDTFKGNSSVGQFGSFTIEASKDPK
jgi:imidazolonepropionase-like amidohydrolase